eukprot:COSAG05_NODE_3274_length_2187_cov_0.855364_1_plen_280_part_10
MRVADSARPRQPHSIRDAIYSGREPGESPQRRLFSHKNQESADHLLSTFVRSLRNRLGSPAPFGTDTNHLEDAREEPLVSLVRGTGWHSTSVHAVPRRGGGAPNSLASSTGRNILSGAGVDTMPIVGRRKSPTAGAPHRNVVTGHGVLADMEHAPFSSARSRSADTPDTNAALPSPRRNCLLGEGVATHQASAHVKALSSRSYHRRRQPVTPRKNGLYRSDPSFLAHDAAPTTAGRGSVGHRVEEGCHLPTHAALGSDSSPAPSAAPTAAGEPAQHTYTG